MAAAGQIAKLCGHLPLYVTILGGVIQDYGGGPEWQSELVEVLQQDRIGVIDDAADDDMTLAERIVTTSLDHLTDDIAIAVFQSLALCPEDVPIPVSASLLICEADSDNASKVTAMSMRRSLKKLLDRSLLQGSITDGVQMHDIVRDLMREHVGGDDVLREKQRDLVPALSAAVTGTETADEALQRYAHMALAQHMVGALMPERQADSAAPVGG